MSTIICEENGCSQLTVAKCMHCDNHLCLKCLTSHQQPLDTKICQLTNDMNKLLSLSTSDNNDNNQFDHPQISAKKQYTSVMEQIDHWEMIMTKKLNDLVSSTRQSLQNSFEQISFEIEEWSTDRQIELQELAENIEQLTLEVKDDSNIRMQIDLYNRQIQKYMKEYEYAHVELNLINTDFISFPSSSLKLFHLFEHSINFDLSLIRDPPNVCFDASKLSSVISSSVSPSNSLNRREKMVLPSVLVSSQNRIILFSNKTKQLYVFSINGTLIDQFTWDHNDIVDICYDYYSSTLTNDLFFVLSTNGSVYSFEYNFDEHTYSLLKIIAVNNQTYYTQLICDSKLSYLYLFMSSKHRLDQWTINKTKRNIIHCSNQLIITNDHVEHLCTSDQQLALLLRDKKKILNYRIELRNFSDLLVTICSIALDRISKPMKIIFDNRHGFILSSGNQLCSFGNDGEIISKRIFEDINEIKRVTFCQRSTCAILTENDQLLFYILSK
ncbi:unnamed protein product [Adineta steineri]|uniref:Uncharacterized protein n=2 Tax=Adineta steineri TaxID=433720 RepID=A0A814P0M2_9BILA|nr:unnamed protein product [Adineta steineri]CAF3611881.1 unnamed protein product [Adineta steineri]